MRVAENGSFWGNQYRQQIDVRYSVDLVIHDPCQAKKQSVESCDTKSWQLNRRRFLNAAEIEAIKDKDALVPYQIRRLLINLQSFNVEFGDHG